MSLKELSLIFEFDFHAKQTLSVKTYSIASSDNCIIVSILLGTFDS